MSSYDPLSDISAYDEQGNYVSVYVKANGGFNVTEEGDYHFTFGAKHPVTHREYTFSRTVYVRMSEEQKRYKIIFNGSPELNFKVGDTTADLIGDATATDELGNPVELKLKDRGGFDCNTIGSYKITYVAVHPVLGASFTESRMANVLSEADYYKANPSANPLAGKSNSRYYKYLQYRETIYNELQPRMTGVKADLTARLNIIADALGYTDYHIARSLPALEDDSGPTEGEKVCATLPVSSSSPSVRPESSSRAGRERAM